MPILPFIAAALVWLGRIGMAAFAVNEVYKLSAGDKETIDKATQEAQAAGMTEDDHKKLVAATTYEQVEKAGKDPEDFWAGMTAEEQQNLKFSPTSLKNDMGRTKFLGITSALLFSVSLFAGAVGGIRGIPILLKTLSKIADARVAGATALELVTIIEEGKILGIARVWIPGLITGIAAAGGWLTSGFANNLNDVTLWGKINLAQAESDLEKAQKLNGGSSYAQTPKTRVAEYKTAKPKLFTGIIYNGQVGQYEQFVRAVDDKITSDADLKADVEINLAKYFATIDNNLSYSIQIKNSPSDELGIPRSGTWATLSIYLTNQFHKRVFIDEILLGPVDPFVYYPESQKVEQLQYEIPKLVKFDNLHPIDVYRGGERIVDTSGNIITDVLKDGTTKVAGASVTAPMVPTVAVPGAPTTVREKMSRYGITLYNRSGSILYYERGGFAHVGGAGEITDPQNIPSVLGIELREIQSLPGNTQDELIKAGLVDFARSKSNYTAEKFAVYLDQYVANEFGAAAQPVVPASFPRQVTVTVDKLNVRAQATSQSATAGSMQLFKGDVFTAVALVEGESVNGNNKWYKSSLGHFVWSGGAS